MAIDLTCYGPDIDRLADLVGDFDLLSDTSTTLWQGLEWRAIADALGFSQPFVRAVEAGRAPAAVGIEAFTRVMQRRPATLTEAHASTQSAILVALGRIGRERGELWRIRVDPTDLPGGACYDAGNAKLRAFEADPSPGYFGDGWPGPRPRAESECGWGTPLVLHLGTFPWVYSGRLAGEGPGLRWAFGERSPAVVGLELMTSFFDPEHNLRQDARQVAAIYASFRAQTAPLLARVPAFRPATATLGALYLRDGQLHVHRGSLHLAGLDGPRGRLSALAYNYCLRRFACFFAVRRATLRALRARPDLASIAVQSSDPCLVAAAHERLERVARRAARSLPS